VWVYLSNCRSQVIVVEEVHVLAGRQPGVYALGIGGDVLGRVAAAVAAARAVAADVDEGGVVRRGYQAARQVGQTQCGFVSAE